MNLTFIVGSGRCGSTMLSRALQAHPDVLSMNEFFTSLACRGHLAFEGGVVDGRDFWSLLSGPARPLDAIAASGHPMPELLYPYADGRFRPETGVPAISHMALPALSATPDALHDDLAATIPGWPRPADCRPLPCAVRRTLATAGRLGGGGALGRLSRLPPGAVRDVPGSPLRTPEPLRTRVRPVDEPAHRLPHPPVADAGHGAARPHLPLPDRPPSTPASLPEHLAHLAGDVDCELVMRSPIPLAAFGTFWSGLITHGVEEFIRLPADRRMALTYEDILDEPEHHLARLATFAEAEPDPAWLRDAAASVVRTARPPVTDPDTLAACAPGELALHRQNRLLRATTRV
ncbi:hypothetical protein [Streptomyces showdoensis]|uniref:hypothetical protein n=1 Tax=Streptomyces showdoensis TaxID=68268 RepID=UPI0031EC39BD